MCFLCPPCPPWSASYFYCVIEVKLKPSRSCFGGEGGSFQDWTSFLLPQIVNYHNLAASHTPHIYRLTISVHQEWSEHTLAGSSAEDLPRLYSKVSAKTRSLVEAQRGKYTLLHAHACLKHSVPGDHRTLGSLLLQSQWQRYSSKMDATILYNHVNIWSYTSYCLCHIPLVKINSCVLPVLKRKGLHNGVSTRR